VIVAVEAAVQQRQQQQATEVVAIMEIPAASAIVEKAIAEEET
jgi:hypothetical protein